MLSVYSTFSGLTYRCFPKRASYSKLLSGACLYCMCVHEKCKHGQSNHQLMQTVGTNPTLTCPLQVSGCQRLVLDLLLVAACQLFMLFLYVSRCCFSCLCWWYLTSHGDAGNSISQTDLTDVRLSLNSHSDWSFTSSRRFVSTEGAFFLLFVITLFKVYKILIF